MSGQMDESGRNASVVAQVESLRDRMKQDSAALYKWGRMLHALISVLERRGITTKQEVMDEVYARLEAEIPELGALASSGEREC